MQGLNSRGLRLGIGHIKDRRDATRQRGKALGVHITFVRQARIAEVDMRVYDAGKHVTA